MDQLRELWTVIKIHVGTIGLVLTWIGIVAVYARTRSAWLRKQFTNHVNFSIHSGLISTGDPD